MIDIEQETLNAQQVKEIVIITLRNEGILTNEQSDEILLRWHMVVVKPKWFYKWWRKFLSSYEGDKFIYKMIEFKDYNK